MAITHDSFTFDGLHGAIVTVRPETPLQVYRVAGIKGEAHLAGLPQGRPFSCSYILHSYSTFQLLMNDVDAIDDVAMQLSGTVVATGLAAATIPRCTFFGFERVGKGFKDGSGRYGWVHFGRLLWIQRRI